MMIKTIKDQLFQMFSIFSELFSTMHYILYFSDSSCQDEQLFKKTGANLVTIKRKQQKKTQKIWPRRPQLCREQAAIETTNPKPTPCQ